MRKTHGRGLSLIERTEIGLALEKVPEQIAKGFPLNFILQLDAAWDNPDIETVEVVRAFYPVAMTLARLGLSNKSTGLSSGGVLLDGKLVGGRRSGTRGANLGRMFGLSAGFGRDATPFEGMTVRDFILRNDSREMAGEAGVSRDKHVIQTEIHYCITIKAADGCQDEFISIQYLNLTSAQFLGLEPIADTDNLPEGDKFVCSFEQAAELVKNPANGFYPPHGFSLLCLKLSDITPCGESVAGMACDNINNKSSYDPAVPFDGLAALLDKYWITVARGMRNF